jgi:sugar-specific transcriptional regulator TrmB
MTDNEDIIKKTREFGLNTYEAKIWISLLSRSTSTAGELSDIANVPRSRSYDVLESLEKKGFIVMKPGKPIKYLAIPPKDVLENVKKQIENHTEKHISKIKSASFSNLIQTFQELHERNTNTTENIVAILKGKKNIDKHISFLFKNAKKEIFFCTENEADEHLNIINITNNKLKIVKSTNKGVDLCVVDDDNIILLPISEEEVHPDYNLCIWIKSIHTANFLKRLLAPV